MNEKKYFPEQAGTPQEQEIENKIYDFLLNNQGSAFTLNALMNRLEEIVNKPNDLEFMKENLQEILNKMRNKGLINLVYHDGEDHYLIKEKRPEVSEGGGLNLEPIKDWIKTNHLKASGWSVLFGLIVGLGLALVNQALQLLLAIGILVITISLIGELIINRNSKKKNLQYSPPLYGIVAIVFNIIGLIVINVLASGFIPLYYEGWEIAYAIPIASIAIICGEASLYKSNVDHAAVALGGSFLGTVILIVSVWPLLMFVLGIGVFFLSGGW